MSEFADKSLNRVSDWLVTCSSVRTTRSGNVALRCWKIASAKLGVSERYQKPMWLDVVYTGSEPIEDIDSFIKKKILVSGWFTHSVYNNNLWFSVYADKIEVFEKGESDNV